MAGGSSPWISLSRGSLEASRYQPTASIAFIDALGDSPHRAENK